MWTPLLTLAFDADADLCGLSDEAEVAVATPWFAADAL